MTVHDRSRAAQSLIDLRDTVGFVIDPPPEPTTLIEALAACSKVNDEGFTFVDERAHERFVSFQDLAVRAYRGAAALKALGLVRGQRVAVMHHRQEEFITTFLAVVAARLIPVPVYPPASLGKIDAWRQTTDAIFNVCRPAAVVAAAELRPLLLRSVRRLDAVLLTDRDLAYRGIGRYQAEGMQPDDVAFLQFTSGSTSTPRGVVVTHRKIVDNCRTIMRDFLGPIKGQGVSWLPLYHDMGLIGSVLGPLLTQRPAIYLETLAFVKRPKLWFDLIDRHRAAITFAPQFALALAVKRIGFDEIAQWDLSCLRVVGCGAEPISADTLRSFTDHFAAAGLRRDVLCPAYGLAEATLMVTHHPVGVRWESQVVDRERLHVLGEIGPPRRGAQWLEHVSCGYVIPGHQLRILDQEGRALPDGAVGEIEVRGPCVTDGYFGDPPASAETYVDGGLRTGDLGYLSNGRLFVTGRARDLVIIRGRNYSPQTIEWAVDRVASVRGGNVVAFAHLDEFGAERLAVVCEARTPETTAVARAVAQRVTEELGLVVDDVVVLPPGMLPKTSSGKVQRAKTRALFSDGTLQRLAVQRRSSRAVPSLASRAFFLWHGLVGSAKYRWRRLRRAPSSRAGSK